jgi:hypothetical protein
MQDAANEINLKGEQSRLVTEALEKYNRQFFIQFAFSGPDGNTLF